MGRGTKTGGRAETVSSFNGGTRPFIVCIVWDGSGGMARPNEQKLSSTLERLVALNPFAKTKPAAWEREQRQDRTLSGRE